MERVVKQKHIFTNPAGAPLVMKSISKKWRDAVIYHCGQLEQAGKLVTVYDPLNPLQGRLLAPGRHSPICDKCQLHDQGATNPYMAPFGAEDPLITVVFDAVSSKEDARGELGSDGPAGLVKKLMDEMGFDTERVRWAPATRCAARTGKPPNYKTKGDHCKVHLVQDLAQHRPRLIMPVGSVALGLLSHKSNAQDWGGKLLTYRGWPDDWLTDPEFMLDRPNPVGEGVLQGHPLMGPFTPFRVPMVPIQSPRLIYMTQNPGVIKRWKANVKHALDLAQSNVEALAYDRPYWQISEDPNEIVVALSELISHPGTLVSYDTETTGLYPWATGASIVFMMFRWTDAQGEKKAIGFPWRYAESPLLSHLDFLTPVVLDALYASHLVGHNVTFDVLFTLATVPGANIIKLANAAKWDTWHMAYILKQARGTLGLEMIAYDWVPSMAGYEEEMTLLIELHRELMHPGEGKGGHYAKCPRDKWQTHLRPYVMGDVEVAYEAYGKIKEKLSQAKTYQIPLAHPTMRNKFRLFTPPSRMWAYEKIVASASQVLQKMMARGMHIDIEELSNQENLFPKKIREARDKLRNADPRIVQWCEQQEATEPGWELDLEKKDHLKQVLFGILDTPVIRLTDSGQALYGDKPTDIEGIPRDELIQYAALDKFTLNMLSVDYPQVRPLQEYKKIFKAYTTYVRPMRNAFSDRAKGGVDKKARDSVAHLMPDGCVHASFRLTGTRSGRLSCSNPPLHNTPRDGLIKRSYTSRFGKRGCIYQGDLCVAEGQRVWTTRGNVKIEDVVVGDKAEQEDGSFKLVEAVKFQGEKECLIVTTSGGYEFTATKDHRIRVINKDGEYVWKAIGKLVESDWVALQPGRHSHSKRMLLPRTPEKTHHVQNAIKTPRYATEDFCFLFGYFLGDGTSLVGIGQIGFAVCGLDLEIIDFIKKTVFALFGLNLREDDYPGSKYLATNAVLLERWLEQLGYSKDRVPEFIFELSTPCKCAFLRGLFESDGCAGTAQPCHTAKGQRFHFGTIHRIFAKDVQRLLLSIGIHSACRFTENAKKGAWSVTVKADSAVTFNKRVGFWSERKKACAKAYTDIVGFGKKGGLPNQQKLVRSIRVHDKLYRLTNNFRQRKSCITPVAARDILSQSGVPQNFKDRLNRFVLTGQKYEKIKKIEPAGVKKTYDLQIEETETFIVDGFISHNSQIELRVLAAACGDSSMVEAYQKGIDLHALTHSKIYNKEYEKCTSEYAEWLQNNGRDKEAKILKTERKVSKTSNFLTGYGGGAFGLQTSLASDGIYKTIEECEAILEAFFDAYPAMRRYLSYYKDFIRNNGVAVSILGRVRIFEEVFGDDQQALNKALRAGCNHLIQSTASDMMLVCLTAIENLMNQEGLESMLVCTVHDSLIIDAVRSELDVVHDIASQVLNNIPEVMQLTFGEDYDGSWLQTVPFAGDSEVSNNWLDSRKIPAKGAVDWDRILSHAA